MQKDEAYLLEVLRRIERDAKIASQESGARGIRGREANAYSLF